MNKPCHQITLHHPLEGEARETFLFASESITEHAMLALALDQDGQHIAVLMDQENWQLPWESLIGEEPYGPNPSFHDKSLAWVMSQFESLCTGGAMREATILSLIGLQRKNGKLVRKGEIKLEARLKVVDEKLLRRRWRELQDSRHDFVSDDPSTEEMIHQLIFEAHEGQQPDKRNIRWEDYGLERVT